MKNVELYRALMLAILGDREPEVKHESKRMVFNVTREIFRPGFNPYEDGEFEEYDAFRFSVWADGSDYSKLACIAWLASVSESVEPIIENGAAYIPVHALQNRGVAA